MANEEHLKIVKRGVKVWNKWKKQQNFSLSLEAGPGTLYDTYEDRPDLDGADLVGADLRGIDFSYVSLEQVNFLHCKLEEANLTAAKLSEADFANANLSGANLKHAFLIGANFNHTNLFEADLTAAFIGNTIFGGVDLSMVKGLDSVRHGLPSTIGVDTLYLSNGKIPRAFLQATGFPEDFLTFMPSLVGRAIEFYSCFISYSHHDKGFAERLHSAMRSENLRVWYAPEDMKAGRKVHEEIFQAIQIHDKLLLVLSENSMKSEWVATEIRRARRVEIEEKRRKLFPIRLVDFETLQKWECFDADSGKDLAVELREYYIPDFSKWKDHDIFTAEFKKLLKSLKPTA
jgi:TIR domain-containing protein/pentapeptide repeat protein